MTDFKDLFTPNYIQINERTKWMQPSRHIGWLTRNEICTNSKNSILFSIFNTNNSNKLEAKEITEMYKYFDSFASSDKNSVFEDKEIETFLKQIILSDNKSLKDVGFTSNDIKTFIKTVADTTDNKNREVPHDSDIAAQRREKLHEFVSNYNLMYDTTNQSELLSNMKTVVKEYTDEFGMLVSTSRSGLLNISTSEQENHGWEILRNDPDFSDDPNIAINQLRAAVKETHWANCGESAELTAFILEKNYPDQYDISEIKFDAKQTTGHVAVLVKDKTTGESYIIDNWIEPQGGIFKMDDWIEMIQCAYQADCIKISTEEFDFLSE